MRKGFTWRCFQRFSFQNWLLITPVYPSETCPLGPIFWGNLGSDRPQVLPEDGPQRTGFRWVNDHYTDHCLGSGYYICHLPI